MSFRAIGTIRVVAFALALACLAGGASIAAAAPGSAPQATRPTKLPEARVGPGPQAGRTAPADAPDVTRSPSTRPTTRPAPAVAATGTAPAAIRSDIGQRTIRRDDSNASSTQPAGSPDGVGPASVAPVGSALGLSKVAGALAVVLALIFALWIATRRAFGATGASGSSRAVQLLSRTVLSPKQHLMLVRVGQRLIVVADSGGQMSALSEITDPDEVAALVGQVRDEKLTAAAPTFGGLLGRFRNAADAGQTGDEAEPARPAGGQGRDVETMDDDGPETRSMRQEINGLMAKVRLLSHQFKGS